MRILVADHERTIADALQMILSQDGFEVATAYDGETAIERARQFCPQIFLCDVMMPGISGVEAAIQVRALFPRAGSCYFLARPALTNYFGKLAFADMSLNSCSNLFTLPSCSIFCVL